MKKSIFILMIAFSVSLAGCSLMKGNGISDSNKQADANQTTKSQNVESQSNNSQKDGNVKEDKTNQDANTANDSKKSESTSESKSDATTKKEYDFFNSYDKDIEVEVKKAVANAKTVQDEINNVKKIADTYSDAAAKANNQSEMNSSSAWAFTVWDKELNDLWKRVSETVDKERKQYLLDEQRKWIAMKDEVIIENIGRKEDGGSMYTMLQNELLSEITYNRCLILARELAMAKHEDFVMPNRSKYGTFVDNQGTKEVYSSLITRKSMENADEAIISIHRLGNTEGTFTENANGDYDFTSYSENVKGKIQILGWDKATFEVTESKDSPFNVGDSYTFDFPF